MNMIKRLCLAALAATALMAVAEATSSSSSDGLALGLASFLCVFSAAILMIGKSRQSGRTGVTQHTTVTATVEDNVSATGDYLNVPLPRSQYDRNALIIRPVMAC